MECQCDYFIHCLDIIFVSYTSFCVTKDKVKILRKNYVTHSTLHSLQSIFIKLFDTYYD